MKKLFFIQVTVVYYTALLILLLASPAMAEEPLEVGVALKVSQITSINQKAENFGVVATLRMEWLTPELAVASGKQVPKQRL